jgi:hypothetical protein
MNLFTLAVGVILEERLEVFYYPVISRESTVCVKLVNVPQQFNMPIFPKGVSTTVVRESPVESPKIVLSTCVGFVLRR